MAEHATDNVLRIVTDKGGSGGVTQLVDRVARLGVGVEQRGCRTEALLLIIEGIVGDTCAPLGAEQRHAARD